jgi:hypothetical protein
VPQVNRLGLGLSLVLCTGISLEACKASAGGPQASAPAGKTTGSGVLTKEEVGAILGQPVTAVEGKNKHLTYKTESIYVETTIEVDQRDAIEAMVGARKATSMLGGTPEAVPGLGDEAFFGAMSTLYVRKGDSIALIQAPNYAVQAQAKAMEKVQNAKGADEMQKAMEELQQLSKNDPTKAGLQGGDATQGAMAVVNAASKKQGTGAEAQTRAMAVALATKLMEKL